MALRFPRGGVGLVLGVSLMVFALYYVGLIGGEALANKGIVAALLGDVGDERASSRIVGMVLLFRMGHEQNSGRGGDWARPDRTGCVTRCARRRQAVLAKEPA